MRGVGAGLAGAPLARAAATAAAASARAGSAAGLAAAKAAEEMSSSPRTERERLRLCALLSLSPELGGLPAEPVWGGRQWQGWVCCPRGQSLE